MAMYLLNASRNDADVGWLAKATLEIDLLLSQNRLNLSLWIVSKHTRPDTRWLKKKCAALSCAFGPLFWFLCFVGYEPKGALMDLLRRRRPAIGAGGHAGGQGDVSEGRQGQDLLVQAGETADQALDRLIVEDLRRGALRR